MGTKETQRAYYQKNKKKINARTRACSKRRWANNRDEMLAVVRKYRLKKQYGLTVEQYDEMVAAQNGVCAICNQPESKKRQNGVYRLSVDHCHKDNHIRKLLCSVCNRALGGFRDDPSLLRAAAAYVETN